MRGAANLSVLMEQHQLTSFGEKFGLFTSYADGSAEDSHKEFRLDDPDYENYAFLPPVRSQRRQLTGIQIKHLQQHYRTVHGITSLQDPRLRNIDTCVQVWHRCRNDKGIIFHCKESRTKNAKRLNHLVRISQTIDLNAHVREGTRPANMTEADFYNYIKFFCIYQFEGKPYMLMYSEYRRWREINGLVKDDGHWVDGFQDVTVLRDLCGKHTRQNGMVYFIDSRETMEQRLQKVLRL